eukprot:257814-Rhodomonas_salina.2
MRHLAVSQERCQSERKEGGSGRARQAWNDARAVWLLLAPQQTNGVSRVGTGMAMRLHEAAVRCCNLDTRARSVWMAFTESTIEMHQCPMVPRGASRQAGWRFEVPHTDHSRWRRAVPITTSAASHLTIAAHKRNKHTARQGAQARSFGAVMLKARM